MVYVNPRPDENEIHEFYPPEFYDVGVTPDQLIESKRTSLEAKARLVREVPPGRLLDIGCQKGEFLYVMKERGWDVQGVEFSSTPPNVFGMPIFHGALAQAGLAAQSFKVITMWAVLEHIHDPVGTLREAARLLTSDGAVYVLVPNFRSIPGRFMRHDDIPRHLVMFTPKTLAMAARAAGLRMARTVFSDDVFSGSTRGALNFLVKRVMGEPFDEILAQNRSPERWGEFTGSVKGRPSHLLQWADRFDLRYHRRLDALMRALRCSFIMTAELRLQEGS